MEHTAPTPRTDTRSRVQKVALELFAEQGYEKTSLREIAERLGVTKAALYYHFKSKEDIVHSFTDDYFAELDALLDWAKDQPPGDASRRELLDRYVGVVLASNEVFRFLEQNRASCSHGGGQGAVRLGPRPPPRSSRRMVGPRSPAARPGASHHRRALRGRDLHVLPAGSGRPGQVRVVGPGDGDRPYQLTAAARTRGRTR